MTADPQLSFVEFETAADLRTAVEKLDGREFKNVRVTCVANVRAPEPCFSYPRLTLDRPSRTFPGATELVRALRAALTTPPQMTTAGAAHRVGTAPAGASTGMGTVSAPRPLVATIMMTGGEEATVRLRAVDRPRWTSTRCRVATRRTRTAVALGTTLRRPTRT